MNIGLKRVWVGTAGLALVTAAGLATGSAFAAGSDDWYTGNITTVADPDDIGSLAFYDAAGARTTSSSTAVYAAADGAVRAGDTSATLFVYTPRPGLARGAWTGAQLTGTTAFPAGGAPAALSGKQYSKVAAGDLSLAAYVGTVKTPETAATYDGVYELRLRTGSATRGVGSTYASAFVKVSGSSWTVTSAPTGGGTTPPTTVPTTPVPTVPAPAAPVVSRIAPGKPAIAFSKKPTAKKKGKATVTVKTPGGRAKATGKVTITFKKGSKSKKVTVSLSGGKKSVSIPKLPKGSYKVTVKYAGDKNYLAATSRTVTLKVKKK